MTRGKTHARSLGGAVADDAAPGRVDPRHNFPREIDNRLAGHGTARTTRISAGHGAAERLEPAWEANTSRSYRIKITIA